MYADSVGVLFDIERDKLTVVYSDKMTLIWDMKNRQQIQIHRAFLAHNGAINDLKIMPDSNKDVIRFATGSNDKTIRVWNFYDYTNADLKEKVK